MVLFLISGGYLVVQGNDEEAVVDQGKTNSTIHTNFEKEELESKSESVACLPSSLFLVCHNC